MRKLSCRLFALTLIVPGSIFASEGEVIPEARYQLSTSGCTPPSSEKIYIEDSHREGSTTILFANLIKRGTKTYMRREYMEDVNGLGEHYCGIYSQDYRASEGAALESYTPGNLRASPASISYYKITCADLSQGTSTNHTIFVSAKDGTTYFGCPLTPHVP